MYHPYVSVLCIHSGVRPYSYINPRSIEHERAWDRVSAGTGEKVKLLNCVAVQMAGNHFNAGIALARRRRPFLNMIQSLSEKFGVHPDTVQRYFDGLSNGSWVRNHQKLTSSNPPAIDLHQTVSFGTAKARNLLGRGWHKGEFGGRWSSQETAEVFFTATGKNQLLELSGYPFRTDDSVEFFINDKKVFTKSFSSGEEVFSVPVASTGAVVLTIRVKKPTSPNKLKVSKDTRILAFWLTSIKMTSADSTGSG